jgi:hypothetical protein
LKNPVFHPTAVGAAAIFLTLAAIGVVVWSFNGEREIFYLYYNVPLVFPFVCYLFDRAERRHQFSRTQWILEVVVIGLALSRAFFPTPFISGHALFLSYSALSSRAWLAKISAVAIFLEVIWVKTFLLFDPVTPGGGLFVAILVFFAQKWLEKTRKTAAF